MILPTGARATLEKPPVATISIILTCFLIFLFCAFSGAADRIHVRLGFRMSPLDWLWPVRALVAMFLHGGIVHLLSNMVFLWVFGATLEDRLGVWRYLVLYFSGGLAAWIFYGFFDPDHVVIGASGCVAALLGAHMMVHPTMEMRVLIFLFPWFRPPFYIGWSGYWMSLVFIPFFFILEWLRAQAIQGSNVAHNAHYGGFVWGVLAGSVARLLLPGAEWQRTDEPVRSAERKASPVANPDAVEAGRLAVLHALRGENSDAALQRYRQFATQFPDSSLRPEDQLRVADLLRERQDARGAIDALRRLANESAPEPVRIAAALRIADLYEHDLADYSRAARTLGLLLRKFPEYEGRDDVEVRLRGLNERMGPR